MKYHGRSFLHDAIETLSNYNSCARSDAIVQIYDVLRQKADTSSRNGLAD